MAIINIKYGAVQTVTASNWENLGDGAYATLPAIDNTAASTNFVDILVGGQIDFGSTGITEYDYFAVYALGYYDSGTSTTLTSGIDALLAANDNAPTVDVDFAAKNHLNQRIAQVYPQAATPATSQGHNWGPIALAQFFGGVLPDQIVLLGWNETGATTTAATSTTAVKWRGIEYEVAG